MRYTLGQAPWPPVIPATDSLVLYAVQKLQEKVGAPVTGTYSTATHQALVTWVLNNPAVPAVYRMAPKSINPTALLPWLMAAGMSTSDVTYANIGWYHWTKTQSSWFSRYWWAALLVSVGLGALAWKYLR